ncbi:tyrosine-type recombinase/integrase [Fictibacillus sp. JL2B1089]|uniref:tyrosine-type recombinase/integrase n=1 Tax=Fictibacillus sp. JL2B1089 TaxID=3399565 RepID=UPI003A8B31C8
MTIKKQTNIDYKSLVAELGISIEELREIVEKKKNYIPSPHQQVSFVQILDEYINNLNRLGESNKRTTTTLVTYLNFLNRVKTFVIENHPHLKIYQLNEEIILTILEKSSPRKEAKLSINTVNKYMAIIRNLYKFALEKGYLEKDLRYKFSLTSVSTLPRYLNEDQIENVLKGALQKTYGYRKRAMLMFLLGTGCRVSELTNIRVSDFNVHEDLIFIRKGKGNKDRYIPIFKEVKTTVLHYLKLSGVHKWSPDLKGYLFCQDEGLVREKKVLERSVQKLVRDLFDSVDLGLDFTVHSFRHTFAVMCLKSGIKKHHLMQMMGHDDPKTTSIYTQLIPQDLKEEVMKHYPFPFEELLNDLI